MKIDMIECEHQPETFHPKESFCVFVDKNLKQDNGTPKIVGCGNIYWEPIWDGLLELKIEDFEAYDGYGAEIINYLMNRDTNIILNSKATVRSKEFWEKMGATFINENLEFILLKEIFITTKYFSEI